MRAARRRVVVIDDGYDSYDTERALLDDCGADLVLQPCGADALKVELAVAGADAVLVRESPVTAAAMLAMPACCGIVRYGIGVDNIDLVAARERRIPVANVPDYGTEEVSDQALALTMAVARRVVTRDLEVRGGAWGIGAQQKVYRLAGKTLGLIGFGRIAAAFARKMRGVGIARVLVHDPFTALPDWAEAATLEEVCGAADVLSLHAPLTAGTRHVLSRERIALLKPTAIVVNTARGSLVDEAALIEALQQGRIFGAGLDVFESEPLQAGHPLLALKNVVLSDHTGWYSEEAMQDLQRKAAEEVVRMLNKVPPLHWLNRWD